MRCGDIRCEATLRPGPSFLKLPDTLAGLAGDITANKSDSGSFCEDGGDNGLWLLVDWLLDALFDLSFFFFLPFNFFFLFGLSPPFPLTTEKRLAKAS